MSHEYVSGLRQAHRVCRLACWRPTLRLLSGNRPCWRNGRQPLRSLPATYRNQKGFAIRWGKATGPQTGEPENLGLRGNAELTLGIVVECLDLGQASVGLKTIREIVNGLDASRGVDSSSKVDHVPAPGGGSFRVILGE